MTAPNAPVTQWAAPSLRSVFRKHHMNTAANTNHRTVRLTDSMRVTWPSSHWKAYSRPDGTKPLIKYCRTPTHGMLHPHLGHRRDLTNVTSEFRALLLSFADTTLSMHCYATGHACLPNLPPFGCGCQTVHREAARRTAYCDAPGTLRGFHLTGASLPTGKKTVFGGEDTKLEVAGPFDACVCAECGYTEWYMLRPHIWHAPCLTLTPRCRSTRPIMLEPSTCDPKHVPFPRFSR
jgi:hypothetical protein